MTNNNPSPNNNNTDTQTTDEIWNTAHMLTRGTTIRINKKSLNLSVTNIRPNADTGDTTKITLRDTQQHKYTLKISNHTITNPTLKTPSNETITITTIEPGPKEILTTHTSKDIYGQLINEHNTAPNDTYPQNRTTKETWSPTNHTTIGDCPICNHKIVHAVNSAVCSNCTARSSIEEWNAYYEEQNTIQKIIETKTQKNKLHLFQIDLKETTTKESNADD